MIKKDRRWFSFERPSSSTISWGGLLTALGLGWLLWENEEDKEKKAEEEILNVLLICRLSSVDPLEKFAQFIKKHGAGPAAEKLFGQMVQDSSIVGNMNLSAYAEKPIPSSVIPFIKRNYYTLALSGDGSAVLAYLMRNDKTAKKEITAYAIRDMENLCKNAVVDDFFIRLIVDNPEAVDGFVKKAKGHVEELIATRVGKQLVDDSLIIRSKELAKERAILLVDPLKKFDLSAFNRCMEMIKDDPLIYEQIKRTYKNHDLLSLLRKIIYQKQCQHCVKDDLSHVSVSLKDLIQSIDSIAVSNANRISAYVLPNKGLSHMVMGALDKEDQYKDDYYFFYHGQPSRLGFQQRLFSWLVTQREDVDLPVIYPIPRTKEEQIKDEIMLSKEKRTTRNTGDAPTAYLPD